MQTSEFHYDLPAELIAQQPAARRDESRLLVLERASGRIEHRRFGDLPEYLKAGDALVLNDSRVIPARLRGAIPRTGGRFELLLLEETAPNEWWVMVRPGKRARVGTHIEVLGPGGARSPVGATVLGVNAEGHRHVRFDGTPEIRDALESLGEVPLPPYISRSDAGAGAADRERYQTVYARAPGSVAAPTAGLHFTPALLERLRGRGIRIGFVTLHVGLGTFAPVKSATVAGHVMHDERFDLAPETVRLITETKAAGRRVVAVGTTTVRVLESVAAAHAGRLEPGPDRTRLFVFPPYEFRIVDVLLTNFHLPRSTLLMLVSAFAAPGAARGRELLLRAYAEAVRLRYRFFSYGDAMLVL